MKRIRVTFTCERDAADSHALQTAADEILAELRDRPDLVTTRAQASTQDPDDFSIDPRLIDVRIDEDGQGVDPLTTGLVIAVALRIAEGVTEKVVAQAITDWWQSVLRKRLQRRVGDDALGRSTGTAEVTVETVDAEVDLRPGGGPVEAPVEADLRVHDREPRPHP